MGSLSFTSIAFDARDFANMRAIKNWQWVKLFFYFSSHYKIMVIFKGLSGLLNLFFIDINRSLLGELLVFAAKLEFLCWLGCIKFRWPLLIQIHITRLAMM